MIIRARCKIHMAGCVWTSLVCASSSPLWRGKATLKISTNILNYLWCQAEGAHPCLRSIVQRWEGQDKKTILSIPWCHCWYQFNSSQSFHHHFLGTFLSSSDRRKYHYAPFSQGLCCLVCLNEPSAFSIGLSIEKAYLFLLLQLPTRGCV